MNPFIAGSLWIVSALSIGLPPRSPKSAWRSKPIDVRGVRSRVKWDLFFPDKGSPLRVTKAWIVWVPKRSAFPDIPAHEAVCFRVEDPRKRAFSIVQAPQTRSSPAAGIGTLIGQGFFGDVLGPMGYIRARRRGGTDVGIVAKGFTSDEVWDYLDAFGPNSGSPNSGSPNSGGRSSGDSPQAVRGKIVQGPGFRPLVIPSVG